VVFIFKQALKVMNFSFIAMGMGPIFLFHALESPKTE